MDKKTGIILLIVVLLLCCLVICVVIGVVFAWPKIFPKSEITPTPTITSVVEPTDMVEPIGISYCSPMKTGTDIIFPAEQITTPKKTISSFLDSFNDNSNQWRLGPKNSDYATGKEYIQNGKLCFDSIAKKGVSSTDTLETQAIKNFDLSFEAYQVEDTSGGASYDMVFRNINDANQYIFGVDQFAQEYYFYVRKDDKWVDIVDYIYSKEININNVNILRVVANGTEFKLYINSVLVNTSVDSTINEGGGIGLGFELGDTGDVGLFEFDNFNLKINDLGK